ncbi:MAG: four helix bundle protein [Saprospiraceae bacterium]
MALQITSPMREKSMALAIRIVNLYKYLVLEKKEFVLSKQILRSGTSPGANIREAQNAESTDDFIHKLGIAQKETDETLYWLELLLRTNYLSETEYQSLTEDTTEILKLVRSAILTKKKNKLGEKQKAKD